ncbi:unnamed protein product, partial [Polarella glacialis]
VAFATVEASEQERLAKKYVTHGRYPQLLWFTNGQPTQYHRTLRTAKAITDFVLALDRDPVSFVKDQEEAATSFNRAVFATAQKGSPLYRDLEVVARKHMDVLAVTVQEGPDGLVKMLNEKQVSVYSGDLNAAKLDEWVKSIIMKSEPVPEGSPVFQDGSLVVVGRTFEELVVRANKDVALLVYAPWCGYCRKVMPVWNSFGRAVSAVPSLVVAKMDGDQNSATNV